MHEAATATAGDANQVPPVLSGSRLDSNGKTLPVASFARTTMRTSERDASHLVSLFFPVRQPRGVQQTLIIERTQDRTEMRATYLLRLG